MVLPLPLLPPLLLLLLQAARKTADAAAPAPSPRKNRGGRGGLQKLVSQPSHLLKVAPSAGVLVSILARMLDRLIGS